MSDVFREVDEELRREQLKRLWQRFRWFIIGGAVLIVVAVAGYQMLQSAQQSRSEESGGRFEEAIRLYDAGDLEAALAEYRSLAEDGYADYPVLAGMAAANILAEMGETEQAAAELDAIAADSSADASLRDAAEIRAAFLMAGSEPLVETRRRVEAFTESGHPYQLMALELLAVAAISEGEFDLALGWVSELAISPFRTQDSNSRALILSSYIASRTTPQNVAVDTPAELGNPAEDVFSLPQLVAPDPAFSADGLGNLETPGFGNVPPIGEAPSDAEGEPDGAAEPSVDEDAAPAEIDDEPAPPAADPAAE